MIVIDTPTKSLTITLAAAKTTLDAPFLVSWEDIPANLIPGASGLATPGSIAGATNGTTPVLMVPAPQANMLRRIMSIELNNADTGSITPILTMVDTAGTNRAFWKVTRSTLEQMTYENGSGFQCFSVAGARQ